jgi:hypothetical protein
MGGCPGLRRLRVGGEEALALQTASTLFSKDCRGMLL